MKIEYIGNIPDIRAVEDCIRATKKYTEGLFSKKHPQPIQGEDFPSRVLHKHYEVYPNVEEISWNMPVNRAIDWLYSDTPCIRVSFRYDYRANCAIVTIDDSKALAELNKSIPGFATAVKAVGKSDIASSIIPKPVQRIADA